MPNISLGADYWSIRCAEAEEALDTIYAMLATQSVLDVEKIKEVIVEHDETWNYGCKDKE
jgi:hypothetical protein